MSASPRETIHNLVAGLLTTSLVLSLAIFLYATFYHAYMPVEVKLEKETKKKQLNVWWSSYHDVNKDDDDTKTSKMYQNIL